MIKSLVHAPPHERLYLAVSAPRRLRRRPRTRRDGNRPKGDIAHAENASMWEPSKPLSRHIIPPGYSELHHSSPQFSETGYWCGSGPIRSKIVPLGSDASALVDLIFVISKIQSSPKSNQ